MSRSSAPRTARSAPAIIRSWKRFLAVGCSHGTLADPTALDAVLRMRDAWKPDTIIHLGDFLDTTAFRSGARGTADERASVSEDLKAGLEFLKSYEPNLLFIGNHEYRLYEALNSLDAKHAFAAKATIQAIRKAIGRTCRFIETYDITKSVVNLGDLKLLHGFMYGERALQEHGEQFGKCLIAHLHYVHTFPIKRFNSPVASCLGYLGDPAKFTYANKNRAKSRWSNGFAWGEYTDDETVLWLARRDTASEWRLPL